MKTTALLVLGLICSLAVLPGSVAADNEERVYEMRTYYAAPGKLDALNATGNNAEDAATEFPER
jgi:hypothetical protein